ncbi:hypothetical protein C8F04DRAFT_1195908 [Mycena alexandri]|uniref:Uncharacterized protein n=1 Tax=Mycena alexandri TaxID=1745969 RepID=A0AAD6S518_9AGAR|nr:hypothetical protein C8F04DRAFT_1195908 [Mycena alexandri]
MSTPNSPTVPDAAPASPLPSTAVGALPAIDTAALPKTPEMAAMIRYLQTIARLTAVAQATLSTILGGQSVLEPTFVEGIAIIPTELAAAFAGHDESQSYWVVLRGREPGLYLTARAANDQTDGVPAQFQQRMPGLAAALALYADHYSQNAVKKLVEVELVEAEFSEGASGSVRDE